MHRSEIPVRFESTGELVGRLLFGTLVRTVAVALVLLLPSYMVLRTGGDPSVLLVLAAVLPAAWLIGELAMPRATTIGGGSKLVDGQAPSADAVFAAIFRSLRDVREVPCVIEPRRVKVGGPMPGVRNVLHLKLGDYASTVAIAPFGNDLHVGWSVAWRHVPAVTIARWLVSLVAVDSGFVDLIEIEPGRALGDSVRTAVEVGSSAQANGLTATLSATFGEDLPIEQADHRSSV